MSADPAAVPAADRDADLAFATEVAIRAGELLVDRIEKLERIDYKSAKDVVTEADHLSEALIIEAIRTAHPGDGIVAEESGEHVAAAGHAPTAGVGRAWVIDPLDGTINYANGIPFFCVSIALVDAGRPVAAVIHDPMRRETFGATEDGPATLDGLPIAASDKERLTDFVVSMALSGPALISRARTLRKAIRVPRSMGSAALALAYVPTVASTPSCNRAGSRCGTSPPRASSPSEAARRSRASPGTRGSWCHGSRARSASSLRRLPTTRSC
jgi:myo-inositol-1(or 4)-monophosphatase